MSTPPVTELAVLHRIADRFFRRHLRGSWVPDYLASRGFGPNIQSRWHAGYAPRAWSALTRYLRGLGYPETLIEASGLARRTRYGSVSDTFRNRAMLPIRSADGMAVAFIGRAAADGGARVPKYVNSPATCLYDKSATLFGLWEARDQLAAGAQPVIVEGPFDVLAIAVAGRRRYAGVAPCGTALTAQQVAALARAADLRAKGVMVAFDRDAAGLRAAIRAYHLLSSLGITLTSLLLPPGSDPADVLASQGPVALVALLADRVHPLADLVVDAELGRWERWLAYPEGQINALRAVAPVVAAMPAHDVGRQVARLAVRLKLSHATVTSAVTDAVPGVAGPGL